MSVLGGSKLLENKANNAGYVFFLARSPEAPRTMIERGIFFSAAERVNTGDVGGELMTICGYLLQDEPSVTACYMLGGEGNNQGQ
jgi:hypothetical protein